MPKSKRVWITGAKGFVGSYIAKRLEELDYTVIATDCELSVCEPERLEAFAEETQPGFIVNCAGIRRDATGLSNRVKAYEVNALGARNVALVANTIDACMVQVSSDDVYASKLEEPVNEFDNPIPDTPYGKSKRAGEMMVRNTTPNHIIVRSSWLYCAAQGHLHDVLEAARSGNTYPVRTDQFAAPTSIATYVSFLIKAMERKVYGTFHIACKGKASRYDFAAKALHLAGFDPGRVLVAQSEAKTAENIILESLLLEMVGVNLPTWSEDLANYMESEGLLNSAQNGEV